jgi:hypothetical protein
MDALSSTLPWPRVRRSSAWFMLPATRALLLALALTGGGCANEPRAVVECKWPRPGAPVGAALVAQDYNDAMSPIPLNAVQFTSQALAREIVVQQLSARRTATQTVQVTGRLVNCTDRPIVVGSRLHFMDAKQMPVEDTSVWQRILMAPRAMAQWQAQSMSGQAEHYVVELRAEDGAP